MSDPGDLPAQAAPAFPQELVEAGSRDPVGVTTLLVAETDEIVDVTNSLADLLERSPDALLTFG